MNFIHGEKTGYHFTEASERDGRRRTCVCVHTTAATGGRRRARAAATHGGVKCPDDAVDRPTDGRYVDHVLGRTDDESVWFISIGSLMACTDTRVILGSDFATIIALMHDT
jgi:hypothetical protein